ncbi:MAG: phosphodiesterase [Oscillospiraceae bacterium]|nr:phosphodiesterase [Oscillospiraceae bacterium]
MKLLIASDIHGSAYYCQKLIDRYKEEKADKLILLGDILYHGPRNDLPEEYDPKAVISILNEIKEEIISVRGNCEAEVDAMVLSFPVLADYALLFVDNKTLFLTHGHRFSKENMPPLKKGDLFLSGHTHIPLFEKENGITFINPGSVSIPKENSPHSYITIENGILNFKTITGEIYKTYSL